MRPGRCGRGEEGRGPAPQAGGRRGLWAHLARSVKLALVLALLCACGGCYDRIELNALAVVDIMGLDLTEDGLLKVSLQFLIPADLTNPGGVGAGAGLRDSFFIMEQTGETLPEATQPAPGEGAPAPLHVAASG